MYRNGYDPDNRIIKQEHITVDGKEYFVSTVDLGIDHSYGGIPLYWETMIFEKDDWFDLYCDRYSSKDIALKSHEQLVNDINNGKCVLRDGYFTYDIEVSNVN